MILNLLLSSCLLLSLFYNYRLFKALEQKERHVWRQAGAHTQRETELLDRIMHLSGNTWTLPPRENLKSDDELTDEELKLRLEGWREV